MKKMRDEGCESDESERACCRQTAAQSAAKSPAARRRGRRCHTAAGIQKESGRRGSVKSLGGTRALLCRALRPRLPLLVPALDQRRALLQVLALELARLEHRRDAGRHLVGRPLEEGSHLLALVAQKQLVVDLLPQLPQRRVRHLKITWCSSSTQPDSHSLHVRAARSGLGLR